MNTKWHTGADTVNSTKLFGPNSLRTRAYFNGAEERRTAWQLNCTADYVFRDRYEFMKCATSTVCDCWTMLALRAKRTFVWRTKSC